MGGREHHLWSEAKQVFPGGTEEAGERQPAEFRGLVYVMPLLGECMALDF